MSGRSKFRLVARHEYLKHVRRRSFLLATFGMPLLIIAAFGVSAARADTPAAFAAAFAAALRDPGPRVIVAAIAPEDLVTPMVPPGAAINAYLDI